MDKVLVQKHVYTLLNDHFIPIKINIDSNKQLAQKYKVIGIPAILILDHQGKQLKRVDGYVPADNLIAALKVLG